MFYLAQEASLFHSFKLKNQKKEEKNPICRRVSIYHIMHKQHGLSYDPRLYAQQAFSVLTQHELYHQSLSLVDFFSSIKSSLPSLSRILPSRPVSYEHSAYGGFSQGMKDPCRSRDCSCQFPQLLKNLPLIINHSQP